MQQRKFGLQIPTSESWYLVLAFKAGGVVRLYSMLPSLQVPHIIYLMLDEPQLNDSLNNWGSATNSVLPSACYGGIQLIQYINMRDPKKEFEDAKQKTHPFETYICLYVSRCFKSVSKHETSHGIKHVSFTCTLRPHTRLHAWCWNPLVPSQFYQVIAVALRELCRLIFSAFRPQHEIKHAVSGVAFCITRSVNCEFAHLVDSIIGFELCPPFVSHNLPRELMFLEWADAVEELKQWMSPIQGMCSFDSQLLERQWCIMLHVNSSFQ